MLAARRPIAAGEELLVSYVDGSLPVGVRRGRLSPPGARAVRQGWEGPPLKDRPQTQGPANSHVSNWVENQTGKPHF